MSNPVLRTAACAAALSLLACPGPGKPTEVKHVPELPAEEPSFELPEIPTEIAVERVEPMAGHDPQAASPILEALAAENSRWATALINGQRFGAHYLAHEILDRRVIIIEAEDGSLLRDDDEAGRLLDVEARVGTAELDSRRPLHDDPLAFLDELQRDARIPMGADAKAIRHYVWLETDRAYRAAVRRYKELLTATSVKASDDKRPPDFAAAQPVDFIQPARALEVDRAAWGERVKQCSRHSSRGVATRSTCRVDFAENTSYYVNSEGTRLQQSWTEARFSVQVGVKADDGMSLGRVEIRYARTPDELPTDEQIEAMIKSVNEDLDALHAAPIVDPYSGPAILQGRAAAVFFHEVFGHRIEGHRQKDETSGQTFSSKLGEEIMPPWMTVYDDPTLTKLNATALNGHYHFDDEGVNAQRVTLVENGVLRGFVQGRNPLEGAPQSNGHGRREPGLWAVSRQGNLVVEASKSVPDEQLEQLLIEEIERQGKPYGMIFTDISGGFTNTSRFLPQSFKVNPIMAYRLYPDGRKELVRGVDIEGTPLIALGSIVAASRSVETFNGMCGAESGWVPVSASAPSLLLSQLEVARGNTSSGTSPTLPPPSIEVSR